MANVLVFGATGYIGFHLAEQLGKAGVQTTAAVRNLDSSTGDRKEKLEKLKAAGVKLVEGDAEADLQELVKLLKSHDTLVLSFSGPKSIELQLKLVEAAKHAGTIKRFVPSLYGGEYPTYGKHAHLTPPILSGFMNAAWGIFDALAAAKIPYTKFVVYAFAGYALPGFGAFQFPGSPVPAEATIYGDGNTKGAATDEADIGKVVARAVNDPSTLNKKVIVKPNIFTQNELVELYERTAGKKLPRRTVSAQDVDKQLAEAEGMGGFIVSLIKAIYINGLYDLPSEELDDQPAVYAKQLYPDIQYKTPQEYYRGLV